MRASGIIRSLPLICALALIVLAGLVFSIGSVYKELAREFGYQRQFGESWKQQYEKDFGSLNTAHGRIILAVIGVAVILALLIWLFRIINPKEHRRRVGAEEQWKKPASRGTRHLRYRRNALLGLCLGFPLLLTGVALLIVQWGWLADSENKQVLGICLTLGGYGTVMGGCGWWLKAKNQSEALVVIAFLPFAIFFVPSVRDILPFVSDIVPMEELVEGSANLVGLPSPLLFMAIMVMMLFTLMTVVFLLPDQSRHPKPLWERSRSREER